jgi:5-deoxy-glucuronate isomerase
MIIRQEGVPFGLGYTVLTGEHGPHQGMLMDFGILKLEKGGDYKSEAGKERAFLLMSGQVEFSWDAENKEVCERHSLLDEEPQALHVPAETNVRIRCLSGQCEVAVQGRTNPKQFMPRLWKPGDYPSEQFGAGTMQDTSTRNVRTIFDAANAPDSQMVLGEVVNHPGKWSSYPPHDHAHPEVYHYRFLPSHGFGHAEEEDTVHKVKHGDTYTIPPGVTHSQCAAPGYAMYYIWAIPHLPGNRFGPDSRVFRQEHEWVMDPKAPIWPDRR